MPDSSFCQVHGTLGARGDLDLPGEPLALSEAFPLRELSLGIPDLPRGDPPELQRRCRRATVTSYLVPSKVTLQCPASSSRDSTTPSSPVLKLANSLPSFTITLQPTSILWVLLVCRWDLLVLCRLLALVVSQWMEL